MSCVRFCPAPAVPNRIAVGGVRFRPEDADDFTMSPFRFLVSRGKPLGVAFAHGFRGTFQHFFESDIRCLPLFGPLETNCRLHG